MSSFVSLSGISAAQKDLNTTSNNIANASTYGFKESRSEFGDVYSTSIFSNAKTTTGGGAQTQIVAQQFHEGSSIYTNNPLDMRITGTGYFGVSNDVLSSSNINLSRNGAFHLDNNNYVVNSMGQYLQAFKVNEDTEKVSSYEPTSLQIPDTFGVPKATKDISIKVNLPTSASNKDVSLFNFDDADTYNQATSKTIYDSLGQAYKLTTYYVKDTENALSPADQTALDTVKADYNSAVKSVEELKTSIGGKSLNKTVHDLMQMAKDAASATPTTALDTAKASYATAAQAIENLVDTSTPAESLNLSMHDLMEKAQAAAFAESPVDITKAKEVFTQAGIDIDKLVASGSGVLKDTYEKLTAYATEAAKPAPDATALANLKSAYETDLNGLDDTKTLSTLVTEAFTAASNKAMSGGTPTEVQAAATAVFDSVGLENSLDTTNPTASGDLKTALDGLVGYAEAQDDFKNTSMANAKAIFTEAGIDIDQVIASGGVLGDAYTKLTTYITETAKAPSLQTDISNKQNEFTSALGLLDDSKVLSALVSDALSAANGSAIAGGDQTAIEAAAAGVLESVGLKDALDPASSTITGTLKAAVSQASVYGKAQEDYKPEVVDNRWAVFYTVTDDSGKETAVDITGGNPDVDGGDKIPKSDLDRDAKQVKGHWITFNGSGSILTVNGGNPDATNITTQAFSDAGVNMNGADMSQTLSIGFNKPTQYASAFQVDEFKADGATTGYLTNVDIDSEGKVRVSYSNGTSKVQGQVAMIRVANEQGLSQQGNTQWKPTTESGSIIWGEAGTGAYGKIKSGTLEQSNIDMTQELVDLITAQRNFQANSRALEVNNTLEQTILQIR